MAKSRKRKLVGIDDAVNNGGIDRLPDDLVINILSHMSMKRAVRTSVLAHRWRYLWSFSHEILRFDGKLMEKEKFESWVNGVLDHLHQGRYIEGMIISFEGGVGMDETASTSRAVEKWLNFAMQKEVQRLELNLSFEDIYRYKCPGFRYAFPTLDELRSHSPSRSRAFCRLRSLRLAHVQISHDVVHYFLASCPDLEELCIRLSYYIQGDLRVVDPPSLRVLEITRCPYIASLEISAVSLVSLKYGGAKNSLLLKKAPNLRKLCVRGGMCWSFVLEPKEHSSYSVQLEKLVLDFRLPEDFRISVYAPPDSPRLCSLKRLQVQVLTKHGSSLNFFKSLIVASPHLCEFRIELSYTVDVNESNLYGFPDIKEVYKVGKFVHRNLKVVEMSGYIGCGGHGEKLLVELIWSCPSLERVAIDTLTDYYDDPLVRSYIAACRSYKDFVVPWATSREEAKERAQRFIAKTRKQKPRMREWKRCQWERLEFIVT
ncbi:putative FBD-associated F-box protein At5g56690 [Salvia miltiorrhiza]|uniref:putative FBD-associated F-box protein At5g56690 n=1 Tax=Salvia miltiorrhiza TaxID=226208 RepID=UPI0025AC8B87|nr:putative FBD-associated F-box protein At5g56690 [Salvia miltiorrhiza]